MFALAAMDYLRLYFYVVWVPLLLMLLYAAKTVSKTNSGSFA